MTGECWHVVSFQRHRYTSLLDSEVQRCYRQTLSLGFQNIRLWLICGMWCRLSTNILFNFFLISCAHVVIIFLGSIPLGCSLIFAHHTHLHTPTHTDPYPTCSGPHVVVTSMVLNCWAWPSPTNTHIHFLLTPNLSCSAAGWTCCLELVPWHQCRLVMSGVVPLPTRCHSVHIIHTSTFYTQQLFFT